MYGQKTIPCGYCLGGLAGSLCDLGGLGGGDLLVPQ